MQCPLAVSFTLFAVLMLLPAPFSGARASAAEKPAAEALPADAQTAESKSLEGVASFMRVRRGEKGEPLALETAVARYVHSSGEGDLVVDLVSVIHIGEKDYYAALNKEFEKYDVVLYELVAPKGARIPKGGRKSDNPIAMLQSMAKSYLQLESQTEQVDYTKENFVHADMTPDEMGKAMEERGQDTFSIFMTTFSEMMQRQEKLQREKETGPDAAKPAEDLDLFTLLLDPEGPLKVKRMMADQFAGTGPSAEAVGQTLHTLLVEDRNAAAMKVFGSELARGKRRIAIFYGAMHMPDFERRLAEDFSLKREGERWLTAWDLSEAKAKGGGGIGGLLKLLEQ